jgi:LPS-assembly protein
VWTIALAVLIDAVGARAVAQVPPASEIRVRTEAAETTVQAVLDPQIAVVDRTRGGRRPPGATPGLLSSGTTFADEIRLGFPGSPPTRAASVIVGDALVSEVRVLPEADGSALVIFVRRRVDYEVWRQEQGAALLVRVRPPPAPVERHARREIIPGPDAGREVTVDAEAVGYDRQTGVVDARGGVAITRPGMALTADEVRIQPSTYEGEASGDVVLRTDAVTVRGQYMHLNLIDETGVIEHGEVELPRTGYLITGGQLSKGYGQTYRIRDGVCTTCRCGGLEPPSWSIGARDLEVDLYGIGRARDATFRIRDVPVLYAPVALFPVNRTRHTGFLLPRFGLSFGSKNPRGFEYEQPFYWAINKSSDATAAFRVETEARVGGVAEYRYALDRRSRGTLAGAYFNETLRTDAPDFDDDRIVATAPEDRWGLFSRVRQQLPGGMRGYGNGMFVSDDLFFREIESATFEPAEEAAARTRFYTASRGGILKSWQRANLWSEATYYQDLDIENEREDDAVLQRLPVVELHARHTVLDDRVGLGFSGQSIYYERSVGFDGLRFDLHPRLRVPFRGGRYLFGALEGSVRETVYRQNDRDLVEKVCVGGPRDGLPCNIAENCGAGGLCRVKPTGERLDALQNREAVQLGWTVATEIARVFPFRRWGFSKLKHTIEPTLGYAYVPRIGGQDELPLYDGIDRINRRSLLSYGVVSRLKARYAGGDGGGTESGESEPAAAVREIARVSLLQAYDTQRRIADDDHVSDVDIGVRLTPHNVLALQYGATYNLQQSHLKGASVTLLVREPWRADSPQLAELQRPSHLALTYRFVDEGVGADPASRGIEDLNGTLYLRIARLFGLIMHTRFNILESTAFEKGIGARFVSRCDCWMIEIGAEESDTPEPSRSVRAQVTLAGIGSAGSGVAGQVRTPGFRRDDGWP